MRIYLDNCCYNRPYDDQSNILVRMEADAKLYLQYLIKNGEIELAWSAVLDYENHQNPSLEKRERISEWKKRAIVDIGMSKTVRDNAAELMKLGLKQADAAHLASAILAHADFFITVDQRILKKRLTEIKLANPYEFMEVYFNERNSDGK